MRKTLLNTNGKKANFILDGILFVIVMFSLGLAIYFIYPSFTELNSAIQADDNLSSEGKARMGQLHDSYPSVFNGAFIFIFVSVWLASIITSLFIDSHPIFFIITFLIFGIVLFVAAILGNAFEDSIVDPEFDTAKTEMPAIPFIMTHIVEILIFYGASVGIALFAKLRFAE